MFGFPKKSPPPFIAAVIVAAGSASRMGGIDKQQAPIDEIPVVVRSISAFEESVRISEIVLVCPEEAIPDYFALVQDFGLDKVSSVVGGGTNRQESVFLGIAACSEKAAYYAIHDGARPLVEQEVIDSCIDAAIAHGAAAAGVPVKDTIKYRDDAGFVVSTPDRNRLCAIQTPQIFEAALYRTAMSMARMKGAQFTDDCQLVESSGKPVFISKGSYQNIKITTPEDLAVADSLLTYREEGFPAWQ